jgi:folate-binding protein YgfZ
LAAHATPAGAETWNRLDIFAGLPQVYKTSAEEFVPQMVNLSAIGGVNFQKGCYPGQEIVARMQYLGTLKRRMYLARIPVETPPVPATALFDAKAGSSQTIGNIVRAARAEDGGCCVLAVVVISHAEGGSIRLGDVDGPLLTFESLPYSLD